MKFGSIVEVLFDNSSDFDELVYNYTFDADGVRESTDLVTKSGIAQTSQYTYYADSFVFDGRGQNGKPGLFSRLLLPWGYVDRGREVYTYIHDYQGNIRAVVDSAGVAVQTTDYYPYGAPMATSTGANVNPYKHSGKEHETRMGLNQYDFHARNQLPTLGLFDQPDPKAGDYPWLNPYLYCAANPIAYIDPTGEDIQIIKKEDQEIFRQIFNEEDRQYISFDDDGFLNVQILQEHNSDSWLYNATKTMATDDLLCTLETAEGFTCEYNDEQKYVDLRDIEYEGEEYMDTEFTTSGLTTGETGNLGKTLFPGAVINRQSSIDDSMHVYINKNLSRIGTMEMIGHEFYSHSYIYFLTKCRMFASHCTKGSKDLNILVGFYITKARREIIENQQRFGLRP